VIKKKKTRKSRPNEDKNQAQRRNPRNFTQPTIFCRKQGTTNAQKQIRLPSLVENIDVRGKIGAKK
jgi:hypothetical protein